MPPRERILLFRSGRHLRTALDALAVHVPGCEITVVATPSGAAALEDAGLPEDRRLVYDGTPFFQPWPFLSSRAGAEVRRRRFDRVCVLWTDPDGAGHANVDRTALVVSPTGFTAITPDGRLIERPTLPAVHRELRRACRSLGLAAALGILVVLPARLARLVRS